MKERKTIQKKPSEFDLGIKELYLMPNGQEYWVISWTKGILYTNLIVP